MMNRLRRIIRRRKDRGQSLVEIALFLPILIIVLAGLVEVSNLLVTQNRVTTASRIAAGFGAANFSESNWAELDAGSCVGGTACAMGTVAINTVTETLDLSPEVWDVWSINATFDDAGDAFELFTHTHAYGIYDVISEVEWTQIISDVQADMITDLKDGSADTENLSVVASIAYHDIGTILGIPLWQWSGLQTIRGLTVMRVDEIPAFIGCPILPIAIRMDQWSVYPTNWEEMGGGSLLNDPGDPILQFPSEDMWEYPSGNGGDPPAPVYSQLITPATTVVTDEFPRNVPGVRLQNANAGYIYWARDLNTDPSGNFGWLSWQNDPDANALGVSLTAPGDFVDPDPDDGNVQGYKGSHMDLGTGADCPFTDTGNEDGHLAIMEWVANAPGNMNANVVNTAMQFYVDNNTPVFLIVFDYTNQGDGPIDPETGNPVCEENPGSNVLFHVIEFAKVRLIGYQYGGNDKWIVFEFLGWGLECNAPETS
jgi:hypothetical protein